MGKSKLRHKELLLLVLPVLLLVGLGLVLTKSTASGTYHKVQVVPLPTGNGKNSPDTQVVVSLTYNSPSVKERLQGPLSFTRHGTYLIDEKGRKHGQLIVPKFQLCSELWHRTYDITFPLRLASIPQSAGRVTFKTNIAVNNGPFIPISVIVREKKDEP